jgi:hypothetical protein
MHIDLLSDMALRWWSAVLVNGTSARLLEMSLSPSQRTLLCARPIYPEHAYTRMKSCMRGTLSSAITSSEACPPDIRCTSAACAHHVDHRACQGLECSALPAGSSCPLDVTIAPTSHQRTERADSLAQRTVHKQISWTCDKHVSGNSTRGAGNMSLCSYVCMFTKSCYRLKAEKRKGARQVTPRQEGRC